VYALYGNLSSQKGYMIEILSQVNKWIIKKIHSL